MCAPKVNTRGIPLVLADERAGGTESDDERNGDDGCKGMCVRMWGHSSDGL